MSYDLLIKNGTVVDGTGAQQYQADVAVTNGKIAEIGKVTDGAKTVVDASDLIVAPGFVDPHTHYDAQICWDPLITSSSWHGVTSLVMGNCGVGQAPCKPNVHEVAAWSWPKESPGTGRLFRSIWTPPRNVEAVSISASSPP